jgi:hypothetical protein
MLHQLSADFVELNPMFQNKRSSIATFESLSTSVKLAPDCSTANLQHSAPLWNMQHFFENNNVCLNSKNSFFLNLNSNLD